MKTIEWSSIPTCEAEQLLHSERCALVACFWDDAHKQYLEKTTTSGWELVDGEYQIMWFKVDQLPPNLVPEISDKGEQNDEDDKEEVISDEEHKPSPTGVSC